MGGLFAKLLTGASGIFSTKIMFGMVLGALALMGGLLWKASVERDRAEKQVADIGEVIATGEGLDNLKPSEIIDRLNRIFAERTVIVEERKQCKAVVVRQGQSIITLGDQSRAAKASSTAQVRAIQGQLRTRDAWIERAESKATRTVRRPDKDELNESVEVFDALYANGF